MIMAKKIIYGVFAIDVQLPKMSNSKQELHDLAESMKSLNKEAQGKGRFVRAYETLDAAVAECYDANGWLLSRTIESPENVMNAGSHSYYFPKAIEVNTKY